MECYRIRAADKAEISTLGAGSGFLPALGISSVAG
jgi:hypothetical protein